MEAVAKTEIFARNVLSYPSAQRCTATDDINERVSVGSGNRDVDEVCLGRPQCTVVLMVSVPKGDAGLSDLNQAIKKADTDEQ